MNTRQMPRKPVPTPKVVPLSISDFRHTRIPVKHKEKATRNKKCFILDTNVLIDDPESPFSFERHDVVIPITVIHELDKNKKNAYQARHALKALDEAHVSNKFIALPSKGRIKVDLSSQGSHSLADDAIIAVAQKYQQENSYLQVIFVTNDRAAGLKARALGITVENYKTNEIDLLKFKELVKKDPAVEISDKVVYDNGYATPYVPDYWLKKGKKRNYGQEIAIQHLFDPKITFLALIGEAGTGKTLIAVLAALKMVKDGLYSKIVVTKPVVAVGGIDIGYLPGTKEQKMATWIAPVAEKVNTFLKSQEASKPVDTRKKPRKNAPPEEEKTFESLVESGIIEIEAETFVRGRSFEGTIVIIDEGQNFTAVGARVWMTRMGDGSKLVMTGDPSQIDVQYLSPNNNALTYSAAKTHGQPWSKTVFLELGVRSPMSEWASKNM